MTYLWPASLPPFTIGSYTIEHDFGVEFSDMDSGDSRGRTMYDNQPMTVTGDQALTHHEYVVLMSFLAKVGSAEFTIPLVLPTQLDDARRHYSAKVISKAASSDIKRSYRNVSLTLFVPNPEIVDYDDIFLQASLGEAWPEMIICLDDIANDRSPMAFGGEAFIDAYGYDRPDRVNDYAEITLNHFTALA